MQRNFVCSFCHKDFSYGSNLRDHRKICYYRDSPKIIRKIAPEKYNLEKLKKELKQLQKNFDELTTEFDAQITRLNQHILQFNKNKVIYEREKKQYDHQIEVMLNRVNHLEKDLQT